jgi:hypothetical protein
MGSEYRKGIDDPPAFDYGDNTYEDESKNPEEQPKPAKHGGRAQLLTSIQIFSSLVILVAAIVLRMSHTGIYQKVRSWYISAVNNSIVADEELDKAKKLLLTSGATFHQCAGKDRKFPILQIPARRLQKEKILLPTANST